MIETKLKLDCDYDEKVLKQYLKEYFGFDKFKGNQQEIIESLLSEKDCFVLMPTGGGKSLCYQLPAIIKEGTAIIISPLIALMKNQVDSMRNYSSDDGIAHFMNSSLSKAEITKVQEDVLGGKTKLLYVAPESLTKEANIEFFKKLNISFYAVDEAHCISEWGHDFRPEYRRIRAIINEIDNAPVIALTATATPKVQHDIQKNLGILDAEVFRSSFRRHNLYYEVRPKSNAAKEIIKFIKANSGKSGIIYCLSRKKTEELAETLVVNGIKALPYHAGMDSATRTEHQDRFLMEDVDVIVATIAFGMGIDKPDIRFVIHYDVSKSLESYYQETGRAGRDGGEGKCLTFYSYKDIQKLEKFMQGKPINEQEIGKQLLLETVSYAESSVCRVKQLLNYFGEELHEPCNNCDNCLHPKKKFEGKDYMVLILKTILSIKEKFKAQHVANVIAGNSTSQVKSYNHHQSDFFGKGSEKDTKFWNAVIRQGLIAKFIEKNIENYGLLRLSQKGKDFIKKPYSFLLKEDHDYDKVDSEGSNAQGGTSAVDPGLLNMMKDLRKRIAKQKNLPPYVIFQDPSLEEMAIQYPVNMDELKNIVGVGVGKAHRYGQEFLDLINKYVKENDIERAQDMVVKSVVNKSGNKVFIIKSIDRKLPLDEIAEAKGLELLDLIEELESIVYSGTKIDINYYLNEIIDDDVQEDILEYFSEVETDSIEEALEEFQDDDYSEEDIRLMRIKFLSDMGN